LAVRARHAALARPWSGFLSADGFIVVVSSGVGTTEKLDCAWCVGVKKYVKSALQGLYDGVQAKSIDELQDSGSARAYMPATEDHDGGSDIQIIAIR
jgi:hypothetical protein